MDEGPDEISGGLGNDKLKGNPGFDDPLNEQDTGDHDDICGGDGNDGITVADDDNHDVAKGNDGGDVILTDNEVEYVADGTCSSQRPTTDQIGLFFPWMTG